MNSQTAAVRIRRRPKGFTVLDNQITEAGLSLEAIGLYVLCVRRPDNWTLRFPVLAREAGIGDRKLRSILKELASGGWAALEKERDPLTGRICGSHWTVFEDPCSDTRDGASADAGKTPAPAKEPSLIKTDSSENKEREAPPENFLQEKGFEIWQLKGYIRPHSFLDEGPLVEACCSLEERGVLPDKRGQAKDFDPLNQKNLTDNELFLCAWLAWSAVRKDQRAPVTERLEKTMRQRTGKLADALPDKPFIRMAAAVLWQSASRGWRDVYPLKPDWLDYVQPTIRQAFSDMSAAPAAEQANLDLEGYV